MTYNRSYSKSWSSGSEVPSGVSVKRATVSKVLKKTANSHFWNFGLPQSMLAYRRNLLTYSEDFSNAAWVKYQSTATANTLTPSTASGTHVVQSAICVVGNTYTVQCKAKNNGYNGIAISNAGPGVYTSTLNLATGVVTSGVNFTGNAVLSTDGYWLFTCTFVAAYTTVMFAVSTNGTALNSFTGDGVSGIYIKDAQLEIGSVATPYQKVTDWNTEFLAAYPNTWLFQDSAGTTPVTAVEQPIGLVLDQPTGSVKTLGPAAPATAPVTFSGTQAFRIPNTPGGNGWSVTGTPTLVAGGYFQNDGTVSRYLSIPDSALASVTGDLEIIVKASLTDWTPTVNQTFSTKYSSAANGGYQLHLIPSGLVHLLWSGGLVGGSAISTAAPIVADGATLWIKATLDVDNGASGSSATFYTSTDGVSWSQLGSVVTVAGATTIGDSVYPLFIGANNSGTSPINGKIYYAEVKSGINGTTVAKFDGSTIQEIIGSHATQATTTKRPYLRARYNLLTNTRFSGGGAAPTGYTQVVGTGTSAPTGVASNDSTIYTQTATAQRPFITPVSSIPTTTGQSIRLSMTVTAASGVRYSDILGSSGITPAFTLDGVSVFSGDLVTPGRVVATWAATGTSADARFGIGVAGVATGSVSFHSPDFRPANSPTNLPAYQRVTTATDYDTNGFPARAVFDGVDDFLSTGSIDFTGTDKVTVVVGVGKESDAAIGTAFELSVTKNSNAGVFALFAPLTAGQNNYSWYSKGTSEALAAASAVPAPITSVVTGVGDISGDTSRIRVNGGLLTLATVTDQGTGTYSNNPLFIGMRAGTTLPFKGSLSSLAIIPALISAGDLTTLEQSANTALGKVY